MTITDEKRRELEEIYQRLLNDDKVKQMMEIPMHRGSNCYIHSFKVAKLAIKRALTKKSADLKILLYAAIFHDYYLYDWHHTGEGHRLHGFFHPGKALKNARRDYGKLSKYEVDAIKHHMFPLTLIPPRHKIGWLVCFYDKLSIMVSIISPTCK